MTIFSFVKIFMLLFKALLRLFLRVRGNQPIAILLIRGGLGNQLFQLAALSYYAEKFHTKVFVCNHFLLNSPNSARDGNVIQYYELPVTSFFPLGSYTDRSRSHFLQKYVYYYWRIVTRFQKNIVHNEQSLRELQKVPSIFFMFDSFQNKIYPQNLSENSLKPLLNYVDGFDRLSHQNDCLVHIRLTDFVGNLEHSREDIETFYKLLLYDALPDLSTQSTTLVCYSDDLDWAKHILESVISNKIIYPELKIKFSPTELLCSMYQHDFFIASQSSINWWAIYLRWKMNPSIKIIHRWSPQHNFLSSL